MKFNTGDRVVITKNHYKLQNVLGMHGKVVKGYIENIAVAIDGIENKASRLGLFYFKESQLTLETEEVNEMTVLKDAKCIVEATYIEGNAATSLFACYEDNIAEGDYVVVKSANHGFGIAKVDQVLSYDDCPTAKICREVVCKADFSAYEKRVENREKRAKLRKEMDERFKELEHLFAYEALAKEDSKMAELLKEYKEISNGN